MAGDEWTTVSHKQKRSPRHDKSADDDGGDIVVYSPPQKRTNRKVGPVTKSVLILVGIPGSGKSTFASKLVDLAPWKFARVNQDSLGSRQQCEDLARKILAQNKTPIIDRCNFSPEQRQFWVDIANQAGVPCDCVIFSYSTEVCIRRCQERKNHETVTARNAAYVVRKMVGMFEPPVPVDGAKHNVRYKDGEFFRKVERVCSFDMADDLVQKYLHN